MLLHSIGPCSKNGLANQQKELCTAMYVNRAGKLATAARQLHRQKRCSFRMCGTNSLCTNEFALSHGSFHFTLYNYFDLLIVVVFIKNRLPVLRLGQREREREREREEETGGRRGRRTISLFIHLLFFSFFSFFFPFFFV